MANSSLQKQTLSLFIGRSSAKIIHFLTPIILVRLLTVGDYGKYQQFNLVALTIIPLFGFGLNSSLFYFFPTSQGRDRNQYIIQTFLTIVLLGILFLALFTLATPILNRLFQSGIIDEFFLLLMGYIFLMLIASMLDYIFILEARNALNIIYYPVNDLIRISLIIALFWLGKTIFAIVLALFVHSLIRAVVLSGYLIKRYSIRLKSIRFDLLKEQFIYCWPFALAILISTVSIKVDKFIMSSSFSAETFALYSVVLFSIPFMDTIFQPMNNVVLPKFSQHSVNNNTEKMRELWQKLVQKSMSVSIPMIIFFAIMARPIITVLFTEKYISVLPYYRIYLTSILLFSLSTGLILRAKKNTKYILKAKFIGAAVTILVGLLTIKSMGLLGAVITALVGIGFSSVMLLFKEKKVLGFKFFNWLPWQNLRNILLISLLSSVLLIIVQSTISRNIIVIILGGTLYFMVVILLEIRLNLFIYPNIHKSVLVRFKKFYTLVVPK